MKIAELDELGFDWGPKRSKKPCGVDPTIDTDPPILVLVEIVMITVPWITLANGGGGVVAEATIQQKQ